jgi:hypothetical protein
MATDEAAKPAAKSDERRKKQDATKPPVLQMFLEGTPSDFTAVIKYFKNGRPAENMIFMFFLSKARNKYAVQLSADHTGARPLTTRIGRNGLGKQSFKLVPEERFKNFTGLLAVGDDGSEISVSFKDAFEESQSSKLNIEIIDPPRDPDLVTGLFNLSVVTRKDGVNTPRNFSVESPTEPVHVLQNGARTNTPTAGADGVYHFQVGFAGIMVKLVLKLDDGSQAVTHLRK